MVATWQVLLLLVSGSAVSFPTSCSEASASVSQLTFHDLDLDVSRGNTKSLDVEGVVVLGLRNLVLTKNSGTFEGFCLCKKKHVLKFLLQIKTRHHFQPPSS